MLRKLMRAKIHRATVTRCDPDYVGSITIDADLLHAVGVRPNESVHIYDINNGSRFETYVILGESGSGEIGINGAAALLTAPGHHVIIVAWGLIGPEEIDRHVGRVVVCDDKNAIAERHAYTSRLPDPKSR
ncbi:MAG: aspartate 1-decarboxylase [Planctomycetes bacterium]|nr:aspartate 1-decarboxylase [Planctomycetota bacterium]